MEFLKPAFFYFYFFIKETTKTKTQPIPMQNSFWFLEVEGRFQEAKQRFGNSPMNGVF